VSDALLLLLLSLQSMAECSGNHLSHNLMASPVAETALKTTLLKLVMIVVSTCLDEFGKVQAVLMFICPTLSTYFQITSVSAAMKVQQRCSTHNCSCNVVFCFVSCRGPTFCRG
jgi:hypothetical protein